MLKRRTLLSACLLFAFTIALSQNNLRLASPAGGFGDNYQYSVGEVIIDSYTYGNSGFNQSTIPTLKLFSLEVSPSIFMVGDTLSKDNFSFSIRSGIAPLTDTNFYIRKVRIDSNYLYANTDIGEVYLFVEINDSLGNSYTDSTLITVKSNDCEIIAKDIVDIVPDLLYLCSNDTNYDLLGTYLSMEWIFKDNIISTKESVFIEQEGAYITKFKLPSQCPQEFLYDTMTVSKIKLNQNEFYYLGLETNTSMYTNSVVKWTIPQTNNVTITQDPINGEAKIISSSYAIEYTPYEDHYGSDQLKFKVTNACQISEEFTLDIYVSDTSLFKPSIIPVRLPDTKTRTISFASLFRPISEINPSTISFDPDGYDTTFTDGGRIIIDTINQVVIIDFSADYTDKESFSIPTRICDTNNNCVFRDLQINLRSNENHKGLVVSPNGDGYNDVLIIPEVEIYDEHEVSIFNKWGDRVYRTSNYKENPWNGKQSNSGVQTPSGTYYYVVTFPDETELNIYGNPRTKRTSGFIELRNE